MAIVERHSIIKQTLKVLEYNTSSLNEASIITKDLNGAMNPNMLSFTKKVVNGYPLATDANPGAIVFQTPQSTSSEFTWAEATEAWLAQSSCWDGVFGVNEDWKRLYSGTVALALDCIAILNVDSARVYISAISGGASPEAFTFLERGEMFIYTYPRVSSTVGIDLSDWFFKTDTGESGELKFIMPIRPSS